MSEFTPVAGTVPAAPTPPVITVEVGSVCPVCHQKVAGPSVFRRVARAARVVLHDPKVDREGKQLAGILALRILVTVGASDGLVQTVKAALHLAGISI